MTNSPVAVTPEAVKQLVLNALKELNEQLDENKQLEVSENTVLFGRGSRLDSLGLVNLIVLVEEKANETFGASITLADERAMSQAQSPFRTVQSLSDYILMLLKEQ
jgi:D-alanine--poly(phosphoribitol) ligase subunit 2